MMWNQWKIFEKMTKDLNCDVFWGPKWPRNWASEADIQQTSKSSSNWHVNQDRCKTTGKFLRKWPKTWILLFWGPKWPKKEAHLLYTSKKNCSMWSNTDMKHWKLFEKMTIDQNFDFLGAQNRPKIGPLRPIFHTPLKVLAMRMWSNTDMQPVKTFWESDHRTEFLLTFGPKMAKNWAFMAHIVHISESRSNEHIKQDWCESRGSIFT